MVRSGAAVLTRLRHDMVGMKVMRVEKAHLAHSMRHSSQCLCHLRACTQPILNWVHFDGWRREKHGRGSNNPVFGSIFESPLPLYKHLVFIVSLVPFCSKMVERCCRAAALSCMSSFESVSQGRCWKRWLACRVRLFFYQSCQGDQKSHAIEVVRRTPVTV